VSRKDRFGGSAARVNVVVRGRDVLVTEQVADADEVAGSLRELGRKAVSEVVRTELGSALRVETGGERRFPERVTSVELRKDRASFRAG
jgi:hypothetical protein